MDCQRRSAFFCFLAVFAIILQDKDVLATRRCSLSRDPPQCRLHLRAHHCYMPRNRHYCCRTCLSMQTDNPACAFGDKDANIHKNGQSYTCARYIEEIGRDGCTVDVNIARLCCGSCEDRPSIETTTTPAVPSGQ